MIIKKCLKDIFRLKKLIFRKIPGVYFTLKISAKQRSGTYAVPNKFGDKTRAVACNDWIFSNAESHYQVIKIAVL